MNAPCTTAPELLLRRLALGDLEMLRSVLVLFPAGTRALGGPSDRALPPATAALVHLAGLLAAGGSTTSLRCAVELASSAGARDEEIIEVLATVAPTMGSAKVVAAARRLALAIGYDLEIEGWDGY